MGSRDRVDDVVAEAPGGWRAVASLAAGLAVWEALPRVGGPVPPFSRVIATTVAMAREGALVEALATSLLALAVGFAAAAAAGLTAGVVIGRSRTIERMADVYLDAVMSAPTLIYVPVLFALFGVSRASQVAVVFIYAVFVIVETTSAGVRAADARLVDMARVFGADDRQVLTRVALPAAAPLVLTGLSLGLTRAVKGMVVGEMVISLSGLGAMLRARGARFDLDGMLALLLVVVLVSAVCNLGVAAVRRRLLPQSR